VTFPTTRVTLEAGEVDSLSCFLLGQLEDNRVSVDEALAAVALTLVRLASPTILTDDEQISRTQDVLAFSQMLGGKVN
jgi:hypothetical protein